MIQRISEPVSVSVTFNHRSHETKPVSIHWAGRVYPVERIGLRHSYRDGISRHHVFSVVGGSLFFRLNLNAENLSWTLEEVSDGLPD